jgi:type II secretory pathway component PulK
MYTRASSLCRHASSARRERGVVFILAVFAVVLLTVLVVGITAAVRVELLASRSGLDRVRSFSLAQAGLNEARAILAYEDQTVDALTDEWGPDAEQPLDDPHGLGDGFYRVRVSDGCGRIDINEADFLTLTHLTGDQAVAAAIIDWRDADDEPVTPEGAEAAYYESLPYPYRPRNAPFETIGELLLVRGVTPEMLFGTRERRGLADLVTVESLSADTDPAGDPRLEVNELLGVSGMGEELAARQVGKWSGVITQEVITHLLDWLPSLPTARYTSISQIADALSFYGIDFLPVLDALRVRPAQEGGFGPPVPPGWSPNVPAAVGKVNVNTAPPEVLAALPGSSPDVAQAFVERRQNAPFTSLREVAELMLEQPDGRRTVFANMIDHVTTRSSIFMIESMGRTYTGRTFRTLEAMVTRSQGNVVIVRQAEEDWPLPPPEERRTKIARR